MKFKLLTGAALAAIFAASGAAAQTDYNPVGWYGAVDAGYHWPETSEFNSSGGSSFDIKADSDWTAFARLGYQVNSHWRIEGELGYRNGDLKSVINSGGPGPVALCSPRVIRSAAAPACGGPDGSENAWTLMANVIYDIMPQSAIDPFIGAGVGAARVKLKANGQLSNVPGVISGTNPAIQNLVINDDDTAFAWQAIAGVAWHATDRLSVDLTYRYLGTSDLNFASAGTAPGGYQPGTFQGDVRDSSVTLGVRYSFAPPPPP
ncbi:MAG TPA: outer membrane protein, partial [Phenylobacterium sp.]|uniref:outer membrane protein n=1 Tax=Phenylobacterium sp. TaxID=1871053 RepID=UPI002B49BE86